MIALKYSCERLLVLLALPLWGTLFAITWCAIKIADPKHPALFSQKRTGENGQRIRIFKFRTMVPNARRLEAELKRQNMSLGPQFKMRNDPRVTPIGRFLRKTHLDEIPQLVHVLKGEMSLVGTRPCTASLHQHKNWWRMRLHCRPGITGLFQIQRGHTHDFDDRVRLEIQYIRTSSLTTDIAVIARTFWVALVKQEGI